MQSAGITETAMYSSWVQNEFPQGDNKERSDFNMALNCVTLCVLNTKSIIL